MNKTLTLASLLFTFNTYAETNIEQTKIEAIEAMEDAKQLDISAYSKYLACYALDKSSKPQCLKPLNKEYIAVRWQNNKPYTDNFRYTAEKLGFKTFLHSQNLPCNDISDGPQYDPKKSAYLVKCQPEHSYLMQFDYEINKWNLKK